MALRQAGTVCCDSAHDGRSDAADADGISGISVLLHAAHPPMEQVGSPGGHRHRYCWLAVTVPVVAIAYEAALRPSIRLKVRSSPDASFLTKYLKNVFRTIEKAGLTAPIFEADRVVKAKRVEN